MAAGGVGARVPGRLAERTAHRRGAEGPVVAVRRAHRGVRCRVGVAAARGLTLMAGGRWGRVGGGGGGGGAPQGGAGSSPRGGGVPRRGSARGHAPASRGGGGVAPDALAR